MTAFVVPREAGHTFTRQELVDFLRSDLPPFMLPRAVRTLEDFPRGRDGKVMKHELVRLAQEVATASAPTAAAVSAAHESLAS